MVEYRVSPKEIEDVYIGIFKI